MLNLIISVDYSTGCQRARGRHLWRHIWWGPEKLSVTKCDEGGGDEFFFWIAWHYLWMIPNVINRFSVMGCLLFVRMSLA